MRHVVALKLPATSGVGVYDFKDLVAWQLAHELKCEVFAFTAIGPASRDFKYRDQIRDSSASGPANIAEGFGRFRPREFARFLEFASASLKETLNHLIDGHDRGYLTDALFRRLSNLARAAARVTTSLMLAKHRQATAEDQGRRAGRPRLTARRRKPKSPGTR